MKLLPFVPYIVDGSKIESLSTFMENAKHLYTSYVADGRVQCIDKPYFIIYRIVNRNGSYSGVVALNSYDDYGHILGHERTLIQKEDDHINSMKEIKFMIKPVLIGYEKNEAIDDYINSVISNNKPDYTFFDVQQKENHELWLCDDFVDLQLLFDQHVDTCFIADGHHRYIISKYLKDNNLLEGAEFKGLLCYYMSFIQLKIYAYNRMLNLGTMTFSTLLKKLESLGTIESLPTFRSPDHKHEIVLAHKEGYFAFQWHEDYIQTETEMVFDMDLFNNYILDDIFNIDDSRLLRNNNFIDGLLSIKEIEEIKNKKEVAFIFFPIQPDELIQNALAGNFLPPKSTWFYPRIRSGIINCKF